MCKPIPRRIATPLVLLAAVWLPGCPQPINQPVPAPAVMPAYGEVVERYNANIEKLDQLWARAIVEVWYRKKGSVKYDQGDDSRLIVVRPDRLALTVGKAGQNFLWAGSNAQQYWFFQLHDEKTVYFGRHEKIGQPGTQELPVPVAPRDLPRLLGIVLLDLRAAPANGKVGWDGQGHYIIEPLDAHSRLYLDPATGLPVQVDLLDDQGKARVVGKLSHPERVEMTGLPPGAWPRIASRLEIALPGKPDKMVLHLRDMQDGKERIKPQVFDLDYLIEALQPAEKVDLDKP